MMTFDEYEVMHERCEMYKISAIKAILQVVYPYSNTEDAVPNNSYFYSIRDGVLSYHIQIAGYNLEGEMMKSTFQDAMEGKIEIARLHYEAEKNG
jgi:hypothetical protein